MSAFPVNPDKETQLAQRMAALGVREADIEETFVRSGGHGGQNVNKTSTCVMLLHRPTGLQVKCSATRQQGLNRFLARRLLLDKIEAVRKVSLPPSVTAPRRSDARNAVAAGAPRRGCSMTSLITAPRRNPAVPARGTEVVAALLLAHRSLSRFNPATTTSNGMEGSSRRARNNRISSKSSTKS